MPRTNEMNVQSEAAAVLKDWRAAYAEIFPHRNPETMRVDDADLALAVMVRRDIAALNRAGSRANLTNRDMDRLAKHNPLDQE